MHPRDDTLVGARDAARYLGISLNTLYRMEKAGFLVPYRTPGGHRRYSRSMLDGYLEDSRENRGPPSHRRRGVTDP